MMVLEQRLITQVTQHTLNINNETSRWGLWRPGNRTYDHQKGAAASWPSWYCWHMGALDPVARPQILQEKPDICILKI